MKKEFKIKDTVLSDEEHTCLKCGKVTAGWIGFQCLMNEISPEYSEVVEKFGSDNIKMCMCCYLDALGVPRVNKP